MPFQLEFQSAFGPMFNTAYAKIVGMEWRGGDINVTIGVFADKDAADRNLNPLRTFATTVPVAEGASILDGIYTYIEGEVTGGQIAELNGATVVP